jgi:hypothetical protein
LSFMPMEYGIFPPRTFFAFVETVTRDQAAPLLERLSV